MTEPSLPYQGCHRIIQLAHYLNLVHSPHTVYPPLLSLNDYDYDYVVTLSLFWVGVGL
jgi:hypothetical protein